jgi:hypothetical protein
MEEDSSGTLEIGASLAQASMDSGGRVANRSKK